MFRGVLNDVHERVRGGTALSDAFAAHGELLPERLHRVARGRRAERQPRRRAPAVRRVHEDHRDGQAQDDVGADLSRRFSSRWRSCWSAIIVLKVVPAFSDFYATFDAELPLVTRVIVGDLGVRPRAGAADCRHPAGSRRRRPSCLGPPAGAEGAVRSRAAAHAGARRHRRQVRHVADGADAGDAARRRAAARQRARHRGAVGRQPVHRQRAGRRRRARAGGRVVCGGARGAARVSRSGREDGGSGRVNRRAAGHAEHGRGLLRRGDLDATWSGSSRWSSRCCS